MTFQTSLFSKKRDTDAHLKQCSKRKQLTLGILSPGMLKVKCLQSEPLPASSFLWSLSAAVLILLPLKKALWGMLSGHMLAYAIFVARPPKYCVARWFQPRGKMSVKWDHVAMQGRGSYKLKAPPSWALNNANPLALPWLLGKGVDCPSSIHRPYRNSIWSYVIPHAQKIDQNGCETNGWKLLLYHSVLKDILHWLKWNPVHEILHVNGCFQGIEPTWITVPKRFPQKKLWQSLRWH